MTQIDLTTYNPNTDLERIGSREHPLGAPLPVLDWEGSSQTHGAGRREIQTTRLGVTTDWQKDPDPAAYPDALLNLYSWSRRDRLAVDGQTFTPGAVCLFRERKRLAQGGKPWKVTLVAVATEHIGRTLHLCPGLMVRLYNGTLMFALPSEVEL